MIWLLIAAVIGFAVFVWRANANIARNLPAPGAPAPDFILPDQNGDSRALGEFRGKWLVLYFYPRDDTPGCAEQAMRFRNALRELEALGAAVCGISVDSSASHAAFARKYDLPFPLLSDRTGEVARRYGSLSNFGVIKLARRNTFVLDPDGRIAKVYLGVNAARNAQDVGADLRVLTAG